MENTRNARETGKGIRLPYILSLLIGPILLAFGSLAGILLSARMLGSLTAPPVLILTLLLFAGTALPFAGGMVAALLLPSVSAEKRKKISRATSIAAPALEALLALSLLLLSLLPAVMNLFGPEYAEPTESLLRAAALSLFLQTAVFTAAAALTGLFPKKKTLAFVLIAYAVVFLAFILLFFVLGVAAKVGMVGVGITL
ncbi:MAG: hypothetical protein IKX85_07220, partial [Clostridia bacterium]|nr:hypothetical protein [Clostridia bacterium]